MVNINYQQKERIELVDELTQDTQNIEIQESAKKNKKLNENSFNIEDDPNIEENL